MSRSFEGPSPEIQRHLTHVMFPTRLWTLRLVFDLIQDHVLKDSDKAVEKVHYYLMSVTSLFHDSNR